MSESSKGRVIGFWVLTALIVLSQGASGVMDLMGAEELVKGVTDLGYPVYILKILGPAKLAGAIVLALPKFPRLKEWAYAGFAIDFLGATASHGLNGDPADKLLPPLVIFGLLMGSYFLRPADRRLAD
ncbi:MAG: DoxX family protein [Myxococcota bacterium]